MTRLPNEEWMVQMAGDAVDVIDGPLPPVRFVPHERDARFGAPFRSVLCSSGIEPIRLPPRSPNLNAFAERFVRSIKEECLSKLILFGELPLRRAIDQYLHTTTENAIIKAERIRCSALPQHPRLKALALTSFVTSA